MPTLTEDQLAAWKRLQWAAALITSRFRRDLDDPGAALFHISVADTDTAMGWFRSDTFKEATRLAKVTGRRFYLAQPQT